MVRPPKFQASSTHMPAGTGVVQQDSARTVVSSQRPQRSTRQSASSNRTSLFQASRPLAGRGSSLSKASFSLLLSQASSPSRPPQLIAPDKRQLLRAFSSRAAPLQAVATVSGPSEQCTLWNFKPAARTQADPAMLDIRRPGGIPISQADCNAHRGDQFLCAQSRRKIFQKWKVSSQRHSALRLKVLSTAEDSRRLMFQDALRRNVIAQSALLLNNTFQACVPARLTQTPHNDQ